MKKMVFVLAWIAACGFSVAQAQELQLANIDTNNCSLAMSEVGLLNGAGVSVQTSCSAGSYLGHNGQYYSYRVYTTVYVPYDVYPGQIVELANIDTNNCHAAQSEIQLLNSNQISVMSECLEGGFYGSNGVYYSEQLRTSIRLNY